RRARVHQAGVRAGGARCAWRELTAYRLYRIRLHRALAACGLAAAVCGALLAAADRTSADCVAWRWYHAGRRSVGERRDETGAERERDRTQFAAHRRRFSVC